MRQQALCFLQLLRHVALIFALAIVAPFKRLELMLPIFLSLRRWGAGGWGGRWHIARRVGIVRIEVRRHHASRRARSAGGFSDAPTAGHSRLARWPSLPVACSTSASARSAAAFTPSGTLTAGIGRSPLGCAANCFMSLYCVRHLYFFTFSINCWISRKSFRRATSCRAIPSAIAASPSGILKDLSSSAIT